MSAGQKEAERERERVKERKRGRKSVWKTILEVGHEEETKIFADVPFN